MSFDFKTAVKLYKENPTGERLSEVADKLLSEMTLKEKIRMMRGHAMGVTIKNVFTRGRYYNGEAYPAGGCKRLGIPPVLFTDGPRGIVMGKCTCFPVSMLRGATFDDELEYEIGQVMAKEASAFGANLYAGVCINLLRNPRWGRAQETYGEDPFLLGKMGVALTKAMQENGIIACPKHYALNSIEDLRFSVDAKADERTLHEVYLPHFKKCIDAGAMSVMGAYNKVNGTYACENKELLTDILRDEWGFEGFALSDFVYGIYDAARSVKAGMDVEMPYNFRYAFLNSKLKKGELTDTVEQVVFTSIAATGVISGIARGSNQTALAHKFYELTRVLFYSESRPYLHGEIVGIGLLLQNHFNGEESENKILLDLMEKYGMPKCLADIGVPATAESAEAYYEKLKVTAAVTEGGAGAPERLKEAIDYLWRIK